MLWFVVFIGFSVFKGFLGVCLADTQCEHLGSLFVLIR